MTSWCAMSVTTNQKCRRPLLGPAQVVQLFSFYKTNLRAMSLSRMSVEWMTVLSVKACPYIWCTHERNA